MKYILFFLVFSGGNNVEVSSHEFLSSDFCQQAGETLVTQIEEKNNSLDSQYVCVPKGNISSDIASN